MELAMARNRTDNKPLTILLVAICLIVMIPTAYVLASALTDPTIGRAGVANNDLTIGMVGVTHNDVLIDNGPPPTLSANEFPLMLIIPLVFLAVALLLLVQLVLDEPRDIKKLVIAAVLITIALTLLNVIQFNVNSLIGM